MNTNCSYKNNGGKVKEKNYFCYLGKFSVMLTLFTDIKEISSKIYSSLFDALQKCSTWKRVDMDLLVEYEGQKNIGAAF
jgi:hypothetical protein